MMTAEIVNFIRMDYFATMPDGVKVAETMCFDYTDFRKLPGVVRLNGVLLGKSGWNSDRQVAYYRSDFVAAEVVNAGSS